MTQEILFFGCLRKCQTMLHSKQTYIQFHETPWGNELDETLEPDGPGLKVSKKDGWTAVSFQDPSMDSRPGAWSAFIVEKDWTAEKIFRSSRHRRHRKRFVEKILTE